MSVNKGFYAKFEFPLKAFQIFIFNNRSILFMFICYVAYALKFPWMVKYYKKIMSYCNAEGKEMVLSM